MAMGNSLSLVVSNIFMKHFEDWLQQTTYPLNDSDTSMTHGPARLQQSLHLLNGVRPTMKFTMEVKANSTHPFLDILVMKRGPKLVMRVYQKPTHMGRFPHFNSNHII
jgi:hypothetical protein